MEGYKLPTNKCLKYFMQWVLLVKCSYPNE
jgi:hypothetical protein